MKVKNGQIWQAREALSELMNEKLPVRTAYALAKLVREVNVECKTIEDVRQKLVWEFGDPSEDGKGATVPPDSPKWAEFATAYEELMNQEAKLSGEKIVLPEAIAITAKAMLAIEPFVEIAA